MGDFEEKLNSILGSPQAMEQIMALAHSLGGGEARGEERSGGGSPMPSQTEEAKDEGTQPAALGALLGENGLDPALLQAALRIMEDYQKGDDSRAALLQALRPFVKPQRYARLDRAVQLARLSRLLRTAIEAFKGGGTMRV